MNDFQNGQQYMQAPAPDVNYNENPLDEIADERPLSTNSDWCYCRNCGKMLPKAASVCTGCDYIVNPIKFRETQQRIDEQEKVEETAMKIRRFLHVVTGGSTAAEDAYAQRRSRKEYSYRTTGKVYCTNCGEEVAEGASVCIHCQYVLNPLAVRRAQMLVRDRTAKLDRHELVKCLLIPGHGRKMYRTNIERRPQIAKPCRIAGAVNTAALLLIVFLLIFFG